MGVNKLSASRRDTERLKGLKTEREMLEIKLQRYFAPEPAPEEAASRPESPRRGGAESARSLLSAFSGSAGSAGGQQSPRGGVRGMLSLPRGGQQSPRSGASSPRSHGRQTPRGSVARTPLGSLGLGRLHCPRPPGAVKWP
jgi:hypothetical protein